MLIFNVRSMNGMILIISYQLLHETKQSDYILENQISLSDFRQGKLDKSRAFLSHTAYRSDFGLQSHLAYPLTGRNTLRK